MSLTDLQTWIDGQPHGRFAIIGGVGSGKTTCAARLEFPAVELVLYLDITGAFRDKIPGRFAVLPLPRLPDEAEKQQVIFSKVKRVLQTCREKKILFELRNLMVDKNHLRAFSDFLADFLMLENGRKVALVVDEAPEFLPQMGKGYSDKLETIYRVGRNWGVLFIGSTAQRPQDAAKAALDTSAAYAVLRMASPRALAAVRDLLQDTEASFEGKAHRLMDLPVGSYYLLEMAGRRDWWV